MNTLGYFEIQVDNLQRAVAFYREVFDWKFTRDESIPIEYWRIEEAGPFGGMLERPVQAPGQEYGTNAYVCSIQVDDFEKTEEKILNLGGVVAMPKFAVDGKCWQGYFLDPEGNTFGLFQVDLDAK